MKPTDWSKLPTLPDGRHVVTLMMDPDMEDGYLSLVNKGANGRRVKVAKADLPPSQELVTDLSIGVPQAGARAWFAALFAPLFKMAGLDTSTATKGEYATTFAAAVAMPAFFDHWYTATDALAAAVRNILLDEETTNKAAAIDEAIQGFRAYLMDAIARVGVTKSTDPHAIAEAVRSYVPAQIERVQKAGRVISAANMAKIVAARDALNAAWEVLDELEAAGTPAEKADNSPQESDMNVQVAAQAAAELAVKVAKANGIIDPERLTAIGNHAAAEVFKVAVMGPAQPGIPTTVLASQQAMSGGNGGAMSAPEGMFAAALNAGAASVATKADGTPVVTNAEALQWLRDQVTKLNHDVHGYKGADGKDVPGIRQVAAKSLELANALAGTPEAPASTPEPSTTTTVATKGADGKGKSDPLASYDPLSFGGKAAPAPAGS